MIRPALPGGFQGLGRDSQLPATQHKMNNREMRFGERIANGKRLLNKAHSLSQTRLIGD
jgi:hypothetical protein